MKYFNTQNAITTDVFGGVSFAVGSNVDILTDLPTSDEATSLIYSPIEARLQYHHFFFFLVPIHKRSIGVGINLDDGWEAFEVLNGDIFRMMVI